MSIKEQKHLILLNNFDIILKLDEKVTEDSEYLTLMDKLHVLFGHEYYVVHSMDKKLICVVLQEDQSYDIFEIPTLEIEYNRMNVINDILSDDR